jgi:hypothetical protein
MHMPPPSAEETAKAIELGHEPSTVSVKGVVWFFVIFFIAAVAIHVIVWVVYRELTKFVLRNDVPKSAVTSVQLTPPEPRLQPTRGLHETTEHEDLDLMHGRENLEFVTRGWISRETGEFRIPDDLIDRVAAAGASAGGTGPTTNPASGGTGGGTPK